MSYGSIGPSLDYGPDYIAVDGNGNVYKYGDLMTRSNIYLPLDSAVGYFGHDTVKGGGSVLASTDGLSERTAESGK